MTSESDPSSVLVADDSTSVSLNGIQQAPPGPSLFDGVPLSHNSSLTPVSEADSFASSVSSSSGSMSRRSSVKRVKPPTPPSTNQQNTPGRVAELRALYTQLDRQSQSPSQQHEHDSRPNEAAIDLLNNTDVPPSPAPLESHNPDMGEQKSFNEIKRYFELGPAKWITRPVSTPLQVNTELEHHRPVEHASRLRDGRQTSFYTRIPKTRTPSPVYSKAPTPPPPPSSVRRSPSRSGRRHSSKHKRPQSLNMTSNHAPMKSEQHNSDRATANPGRRHAKNIANHNLAEGYVLKQGVPSRIVGFNPPLSESIAAYTVLDHGLYVRSAVIYERVPIKDGKLEMPEYITYVSPSQVKQLTSLSADQQPADYATGSSVGKHNGRSSDPTTKPRRRPKADPRKADPERNQPANGAIRDHIIDKANEEVPCDLTPSRHRSRPRSDRHHHTWSVKSLSPPPFRTPWLSTLRISKRDLTEDDQRHTTLPPEDHHHSMVELRARKPHHGHFSVDRHRHEVERMREARDRREWLIRAEQMRQSRAAMHDVSAGARSPSSRSASPPPRQRIHSGSSRRRAKPTVTNNSRSIQVDLGAIDTTPITVDFDDKKEYFENVIRSSQMLAACSLSPDCFHCSHPPTPKNSSYYSLDSSGRSLSPGPHRARSRSGQRYDRPIRPIQEPSSNEYEAEVGHHDQSGWIRGNERRSDHFYATYNGPIPVYDASPLRVEESFAGSTSGRSFDHDYYAKAHAAMPKIAPDPTSPNPRSWTRLPQYSGSPSPDQPLAGPYQTTYADLDSSPRMNSNQYFVRPSPNAMPGQTRPQHRPNVDQFNAINGQDHYLKSSDRESRDGSSTGRDLMYAVPYAYLTAIEPYRKE